MRARECSDEGEAPIGIVQDRGGHGGIGRLCGPVVGDLAIEGGDLACSGAGIAHRTTGDVEVTGGTTDQVLLEDAGIRMALRPVGRPAGQHRVGIGQTSVGGRIVVRQQRPGHDRESTCL